MDKVPKQAETEVQNKDLHHLKFLVSLSGAIAISQVWSQSVV